MKLFCLRQIPLAFDTAPCHELLFLQIFFSTALPPNVRVEVTSTAFVVLVKTRS